MHAWRWILLEIAREPIMLFWLMLFPTGLYWLVGDGQQAVAISVVSYAVFTAAVYGCGLALLWKRESGFLKSFVQDLASWRRLLIGYALAGSILLAMSMIILSVFLMTVFDMDWVFIVDLAVRAIVWCFCLSLLLGSLVLVPLTARSAMAATNMLIIPLTVLNTYVHTSGSSIILRALNEVNPLSISEKMMFIDHLPPTIIFCLLSMYGLGAYLPLTRFRLNAKGLRL